MSDRVVVDASVALACLKTESGTMSATAAMGTWQATGTELMVPAHFWIEVTHVLGRRRGSRPDDVVAGLVALDALGLKTVDLDRPLLLLAIDRMVKSDLSAYDAIYLAVALSTGSVLATLDRRLAHAAGDAGLLIGPAGVSELPATYPAPSDDAYAGWAHSAVVGQHIAQLRREALGKT